VTDQPTSPRLPDAPIDRIVGPIARFLHVEAAGGIVLLACALVALVAANSRFAEGYHHFWETEIALTVGSFRLSHSLEHWINDGLMAIFFFVVGLEVKRELVLGELRDPRRAALPVVGAVGGMIVPAAIYLALQGGTPAVRGWGIPVATDIAFVVGCMAVLGPRVPPGLRAMLLTLAIADDIGAILVIAFGYNAGIHPAPLALGIAEVGVMIVLARLGVRVRRIYAAIAVLVWLAVLQSGVHATLAGVVLGLLTPTRPYVDPGLGASLLRGATEMLSDDRWPGERHRARSVRVLQRATRETVSPLEYLEAMLHPWVAFVVMPLFALANAGVAMHPAALVHPVAVAVAVALVVGKPLGIVTIGWVAVRMGIARLPAGVSWRQMTAAGALAGIGFTMALFVAGLALDAELLDAAKIGILTASVVAAAIGMGLFRLGSG